MSRETSGQFLLELAYDGTDFCGWQVQPGQRSVQAELEAAFARMTGLAARARAASRTDAGGHARGQLACLPDAGRHEADALRKGLNHHLPADVAVRAVRRVAADFEPRRAARGKHYRYTIHQHPARPVLERKQRWHLAQALDERAMQRAAVALRGEHDFSALRGAGCSARQPLRRIDAIRWHRAGDALLLDVWGRAFLKQMVRNIAGSCVEIGRGRWPAERMPEILNSRDRRQAGPTAPARGLCLERIYLDEADYLADCRQTKGVEPTKKNSVTP